jgi:transglutaminase superfamily protein
MCANIAEVNRELRMCGHMEEAQMADIAQHPRAQLREVRVMLSQAGQAVRVGLWLLVLPIRLHLQPLPRLLDRLAVVPGQPSSGSLQEMDRMVRLVVRVCHLRCFRPPLFPRACLRQALALYYMLRRLGYPAAIHFGIHKAEEALHGHSWVTVQGQIVAESMPVEAFHEVYSYPPANACAEHVQHGSVRGS